MSGFTPLMRNCRESEKYCPKSTETPYSVKILTPSLGSKKVTPFVPDGNKLNREGNPPLSGSGNPWGNHDLRINISALLSFVGVLAQRYMGFPTRLFDVKAVLFVSVTLTVSAPGQGEFVLPKEFQEIKLVLRKLRKLVVLVWFVQELTKADSSEELVPPEANVPIRIMLFVGRKEPLKRAILRLIPSSTSLGDMFTSCA